MKECAENFQCRCTTRGPQQGTCRNVTPTCCVSCGFRVTRGNMCMFGHQERDIAVRHGDDYLSSADIEDLALAGKHAQEGCLISRQTSSDDTMEKARSRSKVLNVFISDYSGYTYEPDARHSELNVKEVGLQGAKTLSAPVSDMHHESGRTAGSRRVQEDASAWRSTSGLLRSARASRAARHTTLPCCFHFSCDFQGRKSNFTNSKTLVGRCRDRPSRALPFDLPECKEP